MTHAIAEVLTSSAHLDEDEVRPGAAGYWDRFVGPGQSRIENVGWASIAAAAACGVSGTKQMSTRSRTALRLIAVDLWAGDWVNNTPACVRWYEREGQGVRQHLGFAALHLAHPAAVAALDHGDGSRSRASALRWASVHFAWMLGSSALITAAPRRSRLPLAVTSTTIGTALDRSLGASASAPWFAPIYYTKLLVGHAAGSIWNAGRTAIG